TGVARAEIKPFQTGKACDRFIDSAKTLDAALAGKQVSAYSAHRRIAAHGDADGSPEISHQQCGEPPRGGHAKAAPGLVKVESKMAAFILDDSFEDCGQQRTLAVRAVVREISAADQSLVAGQRRDFVDRAE